MIIMLLGLAVFVGIHLVPAMPATRARLTGKLGENAYKGIFSVIALIGLILIVYGFGAYRAGGYIPVWEPPRFLRYLSILLLWFAFVALAAAYLPVGRIKSALKHPMLVGVKSWALAHLLVNSDLGGIILFGVFLAWAVFDRISVKRRGLPNPVASANGLMTGDIPALVVGTVAFGALAWLHPTFAGVAVV